MGEAINKKKISDGEWNLYLDRIKEGKCTVFVGPDSVMAAPGVSFQNKLSQDFPQSDDYKFIERDEVFLPENDGARTDLSDIFKSYCSNFSFIADSYKKIAAIPFPLIIDATRFSFISKVFDNEKIKYNTRSFKQDESNFNDSFDKPTGQMPLVYKLFENAEKDEFLLTHDDLFNYLKQMLSSGLPVQLREIVKESKQVFFLGFKFERWYVQLLLRIFELNKNAKIKRLSPNNDEGDDALTLSNKIFNMEFVEDGLDTFVNTLYAKCQEKGIIRHQTAQAGLPSEEYIKSLIAGNRFKEALDEFQKLEKASNMDNTATVSLQGQWKDILDREAGGIDVVQEKNKYRFQLQARLQSLMETLQQTAS